MGDVFDLDALERDTNAEPFHFRFDGAEYTLPARVDVRAVAAMQAGRVDDALRLLLGADQYTRLQRADGVFDDWAVDKLLQAYGRHVGIDVPE